MFEQLLFLGFGNQPAPTPAKKPKIKGEPAAYSRFFFIFQTRDDASELAQRAGALLEARALTGKPLLPHRLRTTWAAVKNCRKTPWMQPFGLGTRWPANCG